MPWIATVRDHTEFVSKSAVIAAVRSDAALICQLGTASLCEEEVSGYFMRRSGAKELARRGLALSRIQWYGRWGSPTVLAYVEEALEESAELRGLEAS